MMESGLDTVKAENLTKKKIKPRVLMKHPITSLVMMR